MLRNSPTFALPHRRDIDGLRALAVLSVVGFHAVPQWIPGGFIGVDVFFVISGFLISRILYTGLSTGTFSFIDFYSKRIRRIFPALIVVLMSTVLIGWATLYGERFRLLGKHVLGGIGFVSNFILWNESGYFDIDAGSKPLLHLWSLGVEEQFYIAFPLVLWLAIRSGIGLFAISAIIGAISFLFNLSLFRLDTIADYYSPQSRIWELMIGAMLAWRDIYLAHPGRGGDSVGVAMIGRVNHFVGHYPSILSATGLVFIAVGVFIVDKDCNFPGILALIPTIGAGLVIIAGDSVRINGNILSSRVMVGLGLISYPLYLWHWPLLSFVGEMDFSISPVMARWGAIAISIGLAWGTYRWVEQPIRNGRLPVAKTIALLMVGGLLGLIGYSANKGWISSNKPDSGLSIDEEGMLRERARYWTPETTQNFLDKKPKIIIFGDSQASDIFSAFRNDEAIGLKLYRTAHYCSAFSYSDLSQAHKGYDCRLPFSKLLASPEIKQADILIYTHLWRRGDEYLAGYYEGVKSIREANPALKIVFFGPKPYLGKEEASINMITKGHGNPRDMNSFLNQVKWIDRDNVSYARDLAGRLGVEFIDIEALFCGESECPFYAGNKFSYIDNRHWSEAGARIFYRSLMEAEPSIVNIFANGR